MLLIPVFVLFILMAVAMGRLGQARQDIDAVARDAARAGSMARSADEAQSAAQTAASDLLGSHNLTCVNLAVAVDTSDFRAGGWVLVDVSCTIPFTDLVGLSTPGAKTMQARALAVIDTYRRAG